MLLDIQSNLHLWPPFFIAGLVSPFFFFHFLFQTGLLYSQTCFIPKKWCHTSRSISHTGHLVKDYCSYVHNLTAGFLFSNCLFSSNVWFSNNHFHSFITEKIIYSWQTKEKTSPRVMGSHPMRDRIFFWCPFSQLLNFMTQPTT